MRLELLSQLGGPSWMMRWQYVRIANLSRANSQIPLPFSSLATLVSSYTTQGLNAHDMTTLSRATPLVWPSTTPFEPASTTRPTLTLALLPPGGLIALPLEGTPISHPSTRPRTSSTTTTIITSWRLLHSYQELFNRGSQDALVRTYINNYRAFASDFAAAMVKTGNLSPLTETKIVEQAGIC